MCAGALRRRLLENEGLSVWTSEEINKLLSDSPWARAKTVQPEQSQRPRTMGRRGGGLDIGRRLPGRWWRLSGVAAVILGEAAEAAVIQVDRMAGTRRRPVR